MFKHSMQCLKATNPVLGCTCGYGWDIPKLEERLASAVRHRQRMVAGSDRHAEQQRYCDRLEWDLNKARKAQGVVS
jgi:hypothetical protein